MVWMYLFMNDSIIKWMIALSAGAAEYTNCISADG